jgi:predicted ATP-grasp superfamily ATP-dependent carboligase
MLAGFAGIPLETASAQGPSTVVRLGAHAAMAAASERMIAALGASGFIGFDFMLENRTGAALLLECNPRPIQVCHLGGQIGADLMVPLAEALAGKPASEAAIAPNREITAVLVPGAVRRVAAGTGMHTAHPVILGLDPVRPG